VTVVFPATGTVATTDHGQYNRVRLFKFLWFLSFGNLTQISRVAGARPNHQPIGDLEPLTPFCRRGEMISLYLPDSSLCLIELSRVESMSGGAALGAALITWLKDTEETVEVARKVVGTVWPQLCMGQSQRHPAVITSCKPKMELTEHVERWVRVNRERCSQHLT
jgi:hypothetical protein